MATTLFLRIFVDVCTAYLWVYLWYEDYPQKEILLTTRDGKLRVGLIFGGRSGEHEVSLISATSVMAHLDDTKYAVVPIGITKSGRWLPGVAPATLQAAEQYTRDDI